jgi:hypothetical protein
VSAAAAGLPALLERAGLPLPNGDVPVHTVPAVVVGTPDVHPADLVQVLLRRDGGSPLAIRALRERVGFADPVNWFHTQLPELEPGREAEYRVEWTRAGRRVATMPADGSWLRLRGVGEPGAVASPEAVPPAAAEWPSQQRFAHDLEFFATLTANLRPEVVGATPEGYRINFHIMEGRVRGPRIDAVIEPHGGDWMCIRPDGVGVLDVKFTCRTGDGARILEEAGGVIDLGSDGYARAASGRLTGAPSYYPTPRWSTAHPDWTWLTRRQGIGFGRVVMSTLQAQCDIYLPQVDERVAGD